MYLFVIFRLIFRQVTTNISFVFYILFHTTKKNIPQLACNIDHHDRQLLTFELFLPLGKMYNFVFNVLLYLIFFIDTTTIVFLYHSSNIQRNKDNLDLRTTNDFTSCSSHDEICYGMQENYGSISRFEPTCGLLFFIFRLNLIDHQRFVQVTEITKHCNLQRCLVKN